LKHSESMTIAVIGGSAFGMNAVVAFPLRVVGYILSKTLFLPMTGVVRKRRNMYAIGEKRTEDAEMALGMKRISGQIADTPGEGATSTPMDNVSPSQYPTSHQRYTTRSILQPRCELRLSGVSIWYAIVA